MKPIYDIDRIERDYRAMMEGNLAQALERAQTDRDRRLILAQRHLGEATIIQIRVLMELLNEGADEALIATAFAAALGSINRTLVSSARDPGAMADIVFRGMTDPGGVASSVTGSVLAKPVMGGRA